MKRLVTLVVLLSWGLMALPQAHAQRLTYFSQPQRLAVFMNNIALGQDQITLPAESDLEVALPPQVLADTLLVRADDQPLALYRLRFEGDGYRLSIPPSDQERQLSFSYLMSGISWRPLYNLWISPTDTGQVRLELSMELQNTAFDLVETQVTLVAGRVDSAQVLDQAQTMSANQMLVDYEASAGELGTGPVSIQHLYELGPISAALNETVVLNQVAQDFPARRVILWNAQSDTKVSLIYKVQNNSALPWPDGVVRTYQDGLFVGADAIETTPIGGEGSVTAGGLENIRVARDETSTRQDFGIRGMETTYQVSLSLTNFSQETVTVEVVDYWNPDGEAFQFSSEPERAPNNLLRWVVTLPANETVTLEYQYTTPY
jgi:hypothetical protein